MGMIIVYRKGTNNSWVIGEYIVRKPAIPKILACYADII